jgi:hypothetical protein
MAELIDRFPEISLFLMTTSFHPFELFRNQEGKINAKRGRDLLHSPVSIAKEVHNWLLKTDFHGVEILYIYGLGLGYYYEPVKNWLREKRERALVFIEDDLAVIDACFRAKAVDFLTDPQVHLRFIPHKRAWKQTLESLVHFFPSDRILFTALESYQVKYTPKIARMRLYLQRASAVFETLLSEVLNSHRLFANLYPNFTRLPSSFFVNEWKGRFANVPAIICGAGPSLTKAIPLLREIEDKALIIAGGSTITALSTQGIIPHLGVALDPNPVEFERLKMSSAFEMPFIYAPRLFPDVFSLFNGPLGYMRSDTGGATESWVEKQLKIERGAIGPDLGREAFSVTTLAVALAEALGCSPIILVGIDLAFTENKTYAAGVVPDERAELEKLKKETNALNHLLRKKDRRGTFVYTTLKWVMESATLSHYAKSHATTRFVNCTEGGIGFEEIPYMSLARALNRHCVNSYDLRARVHAEIEQTRFSSVSLSHIEQLFEEVRKSLERSAFLVKEMLSAQSSGKRILLEMDFHEEIAYECCLQAVGAAIERITQRFLPNCFEEKCHQYETMIKKYLEILEGRELSQ